MLAYSNNAKFTINGTIQEGDNIKTVGEGNLGIASGSTLEEIIKGFTQEQLKSGEVAFSLNSFKPSVVGLGIRSWVKMATHILS